MSKFYRNLINVRLKGVASDQAAMLARDKARDDAWEITWMSLLDEYEGVISDFLQANDEFQAFLESGSK